jgi:hypothetical protein
MKKKKMLIGNIIQYIWKDDFKGTYGIVVRLNPMGRPSDGQVVWFDKKPIYKEDKPYHVSGFLYSNKMRGTDCKIVLAPPKKVLKRMEEALDFFVEETKKYGPGSKFSNLDYIEALARAKKII